MHIKKDDRDAISELESLSKRDVDRPSLKTFFLLEFFKWGGMIVAIYVLVTLTWPHIKSAYDFTAWLLFVQYAPVIRGLELLDEF